MMEMEKILEDIRNNRCILFLGPLMPVVRYKGERMSLSKIFSAHILDKLGDAVVTETTEDISHNYYYLVTKYINHVGGRENFERELKLNNSFFDRPSSVYYFLSKLPFNTIINFGYDRAMQRALIKNKFEFSDKYYDYSGKYQQYLDGIDNNLLLVYNLLGSVYNIQSQVLTEDDQLEFMKRIVSGPKLPDNLLSRIKENPGETKSYIFLGFNFEEWPFRFLLDVLQLPKTKSSASPKLPDYNIALMTQEFYQQKFGLKFYSNSPEEFARLLIDEYTTKYGFNIHKNGFISFHQDDKNIFDKFNVELENQKLGKRIKFWDKSSLMASQITEQEISENLKRATIYIPFISARFLNDPSLSKELRFMLSKPDTLTFPIITRNCDFESDFPELRSQASIILPGSDSVLVNAANPEPSSEDYIAIIKKINSKIR